MHPSIIHQLIGHFNKLPGVGPKTAERFVFSLIRLTEQELKAFAASIAKLKESIQCCKNCFNLTSGSLCSICGDNQRDPNLLCIVADPRDVAAIEQTGSYHGLYFVLGENLDPMRGITPEYLHINELRKRLSDTNHRPREIILGLNPTMEGDATKIFLKKLFQQYSTITLTQLGRGLPTGGDIEYADAKTICEALNGRRQI